MVNDWTSGYVADIDYIYGYYQELNPLRVRLPFLRQGINIPTIRTACELGYGQGLSTNIHAAASTIEWYGTDFNPAQASFAQELAASSNSNAKLTDEAFTEFCRRDDLPNFDFIGLHGIWSWVSDENRQVIANFVRRKLNVGGVLYISYNTYPGWASFAPMRHLMTQHADVIGSAGSGIKNRIDEAIIFAEKLLEVDPRFKVENSGISQYMDEIKSKNRNYLAHEYFNKDWQPMHFAEMKQWLQPAKLDYACSANYLDHYEGINLTKEQMDFVNEIPDVLLRESTRDFMVNQRFRRDYWIKGKRNLSPLDSGEILKKQRILLANDRDQISLKVKGPQGEATMNEEMYYPIIDALDTAGIMSIAELSKKVASKNLRLQQVLEVVMVLAASGDVALAQSEEETEACAESSDKLNDHLIQKARSSNEIGYLASPVSGGGIVVDRFQQLFVAAMKQGKKTPDELGNWAWSILKLQGQALVVEGSALQKDEDNIAELNKRASEFLGKKSNALTTLKIV